jgi:hypothetical protein
MEKRFDRDVATMSRIVGKLKQKSEENSVFRERLLYFMDLLKNTDMQ